jgi:hypothetical protein
VKLKSSAAIVLQSSELEREVLCAGFAAWTNSEPASFEDLQHWRIVRKNVRTKFAQAAVPGDRDKVTQERRANPFALILIHDHKSQFRLARLSHYITSAAGNSVSPVCFNDCNQSDVFYEVDIYKERGLAIAKISARREESPVN